jgi:hypothetical protein
MRCKRVHAGHVTLWYSCALSVDVDSSTNGSGTFIPVRGHWYTNVSIVKVWLRKCNQL